MTQEHAQHPAKCHRWITTFSGQRINSLDVKLEQINVHDMVRGLAMQTRYLGQIKDFYSIAEHSVLVSNISELMDDDLPTQRCALLHDGHEYITGDFPSPFKYDVPGLREWEGEIEARFRAALNLPYQGDPVWQKIKLYDLLALHFEADFLMEQNAGWVELEKVQQVQRLGLKIRCFDAWQARSIFKVRARDLGISGF